MPLLNLVLWIVVGTMIAWFLLPLIGVGLLFFLAILAVLFVVNLFTGKGGISFRTFKVSPGQKARETKAEQEETFDAEYGEDAGEFVELPSTALHKEDDLE